MATLEQKQQYVLAIESVWEGSMNGNSVDNIFDEVIASMDAVLDQISQCSKAFLTMDVTFSIFYNPPGSWAEALVTASMNGLTGSVKGWVEALRGSSYKACVVTAAANHKSRVQMALWGI